MTRAVVTSWQHITALAHGPGPAIARLVNPSATPAVDLRSLEAATKRLLPRDLVELLRLANGTEHRSIRGAVIPTLYNLVPAMEMLELRRRSQKIWSGIDADLPARLDECLPIAQAADAGLVCVDLRDGPSYGAVCE